MEKERAGDAAQSYTSLLKLFEDGKRGDWDAIKTLLKLFESDMEYQASFIKMPRDDVLQTLRAEFIEFIRKGDFPWNDRSQ